VNKLQPTNHVASFLSHSHTYTHSLTQREVARGGL
jgi:hypothetical protein